MRWTSSVGQVAPPDSRAIPRRTPPWSGCATTKRARELRRRRRDGSYKLGNYHIPMSLRWEECWSHYSHVTYIPCYLFQSRFDGASATRALLAYALQPREQEVRQLIPLLVIMGLYCLRSVFIISNRTSQILKANMLFVCPYCLTFQIARV